MRRTIAVLTLGCAACLPLAAHADGGLELRLGGFIPRADSTRFADNRELFGTTKRDWRGATGGLEIAAGLAPNVELGVALDIYSRTRHTAYVGYGGDNDRDIPQTLKLTLVPVTLNLRAIAGDRYSSLRPYVTVGGGIILWKYEANGEFIDFDSPDLEIVPDSFRAEGGQAALHVAGGLRLRLTHDLSLTSEARYQWAKRDVMGDDFAPRGGLVNELDLNGASFTVGLHLGF